MAGRQTGAAAELPSSLLLDPGDRVLSVHVLGVELDLVAWLGLQWTIVKALVQIVLVLQSA